MNFISLGECFIHEGGLRKGKDGCGGLELHILRCLNQKRLFQGFSIIKSSLRGET